MPALGPRQVEPDAWQEWLKEGATLLGRRPMLTLKWTVVSLFLFYMSHRMSWPEFRYSSHFFLVGLGLMLFIRLASAVDNRRRTGWRDLLPTNRDAVLALGLAAALFAILTALGAMLGPLADAFRQTVEGFGLWSPVTAEGLPAPPPLSQLLLGPVLVPGGTVGLALVASLALLLAFGQFFLLPMMVLHQPPLPPAMVMSARAYPLNPVPIMGLSGVLMLAPLLLVISLGWVGMVVVPYAGSVLYVAYRDVFLGEAEAAGEPLDDDAEELPHGYPR
ncbi:MAG: hypothetical protein JJT90_07685 [Ectothiorhodospiraceae bacterium]|nr:hypothetical protein [Ectothiorhodospiraceae bacterium]